MELDAISLTCESEPELASIKSESDIDRVTAPYDDLNRTSHRGLVIGTLVQLGDDGTPYVAMPGIQSIFQARGMVRLSIRDIGRSVVVGFENEDRAKPIVLGLLDSPTSDVHTRLPGMAEGDLKADVEADGQRIVLTAEKEIVLRCGKASITLTQAGKILIRGAYVLNRSSGVNRIKGGVVHINQWHMWSLTNRSPFAAERCWVRDKVGAEVWLVAVKGTFTIKSDGSTKLAKEQHPVCMAPEYTGEPAKSSLRYDSDLNHKKLRTDVVLHGHAYAPQGKPARMVDVTLKVANVNKTLRVFGDRLWNTSLLGMHASEPAPFTAMPLSYERAFGGVAAGNGNSQYPDFERRNPIGVGFATRKEDLVGKPLPNIESSGFLIAGWNDRPDPVGFGPIPGHWSPRVELTGTYDEKWEQERQPLLPDDFDEQFYQCAPRDQQAAGFLRGGELVELTNLTPDGLSRFFLPRVTLGFTTYFDDGSEQRHRAALHTVILEPDLAQVSLVWHTHLPCHHKVLKLSTTTIEIKRRLRVSDSERGRGVWTGGSNV